MDKQLWIRKRNCQPIKVGKMSQNCGDFVTAPGYIDFASCACLWLVKLGHMVQVEMLEPVELQMSDQDAISLVNKILKV